ncbi:uncharacterized protein LOC111377755, partial [Olea europaea var. sylvestris]|uniref:uncharacterized protein LOC111377755 n=1 Tax=Olea europaea var. sylvestris TaxID=158386 RepID=UPI000C1D23AC
MYFKHKFVFPYDEQNINERNVRDRRDENDVGDKKDNEFGDEMNEIDETSLEDVPIETNVKDAPVQNYDADVRDVILKAYVQKNPCQPRNHEFPPKRMANKDRSFCVSWFNEYPSLLEYIVQQKMLYFAYTAILLAQVMQSHQARTNYRIRLNASIDCVRFLLQQEMTFRGHDGFEDLNNRGNFLELLHWLCYHNAEIALEKSQIDITTSSERHLNEQISVVIHYMKNGHVLEQFIGVTYVLSTTAVTLKTAIDQLFSTHSLTFVAVSQKHLKIEAFFTSVHRLVNIVGGSAQQSDLIREKQRLKILEALSVGEISSGRGLNQETTLKRSGDTCWGSYYSCLINMILMFSAIVDVVEAIATDIQVPKQE